MSSSRRRQQREDGACGHKAAPRREGGWDHMADCPCGAGAMYVRRAVTMRRLPKPPEATQPRREL